MKAFKAWWKQIDGDVTREYGDSEVTAEMAWKAALIRILEDINGHGYDYSTYEIKCRIEEELEEPKNG